MERENKRRSSHWRSDPPELASIALPRHCSTNGHQKRGKCLLSHLFQKSLVTSTPLSGTTKAPCVSTRHRSENVTEFQAILQADHLTTVPCFSPPENSSCWSRIGRRWCCCGTRPGSPGSEPTSQRKPVWSTAFCLLDQRFLSENQKSSNCGGNWCPNEEPFGASSSLSGNPLGLAHLHRRSAGFGELHIAGDSDIHKKGPEMNKENLPFTRTQVILHQSHEWIKLYHSQFPLMAHPRKTATFGSQRDAATCVVGCRWCPTKRWSGYFASVMGRSNGYPTSIIQGVCI